MMLHFQARRRVQTPLHRPGYTLAARRQQPDCAHTGPAMLHAACIQISVIRDDRSPIGCGSAPMLKEAADVLIIGGGGIGCATAYFLTSLAQERIHVVVC